MLDSHGDADEVLSEGQPAADILGHGEVGHGPRLLDQALNPPERLGEDEDLQVREQVLRHIAVGDTEGERPPVARHLALGQLMLWVRL